VVVSVYLFSCVLLFTVVFIVFSTFSMMFFSLLVYCFMVSFNSYIIYCAIIQEHFCFGMCVRPHHSCCNLPREAAPNCTVCICYHHQHCSLYTAIHTSRRQFILCKHRLFEFNSAYLLFALPVV